MATLDLVLAEAFKLSTLDKVRLIERVSPKIEEEIARGQALEKPAYRSLWGLCRDLGQAPSREVIDASRHELWTDFARNDLA